jgi:flagellar hook-length control protein FliK
MSSNDYGFPNRDSSTAEPSPNEAATTTETAAAAETAKSDVQIVDAEDHPNAEESSGAPTTHPNGGPAAILNETGDSEHDEDEAHADEQVIGGAERCYAITAATPESAELPVTTAADDEKPEASSSKATITVDPSANRTDAERLTEASRKVEALTNNSRVEMAESPAAPAPPGEPVDEAALLKTTRKVPAAKPKPAPEIEESSQRGEQNGIQAGRVEPNGNAGVPADIAKAETESPSIEQTLSESGHVEGEAGSDENGEAHVRSAARQRSDAVALANKITTASAANVSATPSSSGASSPDTIGGTGRAGNAAATNVDTVGDAAGRLHANAASSKRAGKSTSGDETPRIDPARFVGRVAKAFHTAQERGGTLQIRLSPPELGAMRLELTVKDGVMTAALETETTSARRVLLEHLPALRERLAEQNIRVERFDVDVRRETGNGQADPRATQDQQQPQQGSPEQRRRPATEPQITRTAGPVKAVTPGRIGNDSINVIA